MYTQTEDRLYNESGEVAVIVCPGYGAGWSSWMYDTETARKAVFDPVLARAILDGVSSTELKNLASDRYPLAFSDGLVLDGVVKWVSRGSPFYIKEYDGYETIESIFVEDFYVA